MKRLLHTLIAASLLSAFSVSAYAEGVDHVSTEGAICSDREAGKAINDSTSSDEAEAAGVTAN